MSSQDVARELCLQKNVGISLQGKAALEKFSESGDTQIQSSVEIKCRVEVH